MKYFVIAVYAEDGKYLRHWTYESPIAHPIKRARLDKEASYVARHGGFLRCKWFTNDTYTHDDVWTWLRKF